MLKGVKVEDEVKCNEEKGTIKQFLWKVEVNQRLIFAGVEKGLEMHKNDVLVIIGKILTDT